MVSIAPHAPFFWYVDMGLSTGMGALASLFSVK